MGVQVVRLILPTYGCQPACKHVHMPAHILVLAHTCTDMRKRDRAHTHACTYAYALTHASYPHNHTESATAHPLATHAL